ncbi:LicD family protein [Aestuariivivens sediminicola]|uniref:LicD family protein n=1 Tax=Aestuariivivens sediminicola TaxID=2913560 RepID=UPI001F5A9A09|nr:LicD family protein [Aestuariivivens sediminicola]
MIKEIITNKGIITYKETIPVSGTKYINLELAKQNLLDLKGVLDGNNIKFGLIYGTLLGAIRENNFIEHDEDIDLYILEEHKEALLDVLPEVIELGFSVIRYDGKLLSIKRHEEYIDFYFFKKTSSNYRKCDLGLKAKCRYLENTEDYEFLGSTFQIPVEPEKFLVDLYGKNWRTPVKDVAAIEFNKYIIFRETIRKNLPFLFLILNKLKGFFRRPEPN